MKDAQWWMGYEAGVSAARAMIDEDLERISESTSYGVGFNEELDRVEQRSRLFRHLQREMVYG